MKIGTKKWNEEDIQNASLDYSNRMDLFDMSKKYGRSEQAIQRKMCYLGIEREWIFPEDTKKYSLSISKDDIVRLYQEGKSSEEIAKICNCTASNIISILNRKNIRKRNMSLCHRKYKLDEHFFDVIDTEAKAYFLGFLSADGCNHRGKKSNNITMSLQKRDKGILEKFKEVVNSERGITFVKGNKESGFGGGDQYRFSIASKHMARVLDGVHGLTPRKSLTLKFPNTIPDHLIHHFIRGYMDGDGWVTRSGKSITIGFIGTKEFLIKVQEEIQKYCAGRSRLIRHNQSCDKSINSYVMSYSGNNFVERIQKFLYKDATIFLGRKKDKLDIHRLENPRQRIDYVLPPRKSDQKVAV